MVWNQTTESQCALGNHCPGTKTFPIEQSLFILVCKNYYLYVFLSFVLRLLSVLFGCLSVHLMPITIRTTTALQSSSNVRLVQKLASGLFLDTLESWLACASCWPLWQESCLIILMRRSSSPSASSFSLLFGLLLSQFT